MFISVDRSSNEIHKRPVENHYLWNSLVNRIASAEEWYGELFNRHGAFPMLTTFMQNSRSAIEHRNKHESTLTYTDPKQFHRSITASSRSVVSSYGRLHVRSQRIKNRRAVWTILHFAKPCQGIHPESKAHAQITFSTTYGAPKIRAALHRYSALPPHSMETLRSAIWPCSYILSAPSPFGDHWTLQEPELECEVCRQA